MKLDFRYKKHKIIYTIASVLGAFVLLFVAWQIYIPIKPWSNDTIVYVAKRGMGDDEISVELKNLGIIKNNNFFVGYVVLTFQHSKLQAGKYVLSPSMSVAQIVGKMVAGDVLKQKILIYEGWDLKDIKDHLKKEELLNEEDFVEAVNKDYSKEYDFLIDKPKDLSLEGYIFPDTYEISVGETTGEFVEKALANFDDKLTPDLRAEIKKQNKSIFEIVTMASLLEKEVKTLEDKKIASGILWKRISVDMPLQLDSTVNYITDGNDASVAIKDTKIDSLYNTYKYKGLPLGPISNPGMDSIMAAIYPKKTDYWYYLSATVTGKTIFSRTLAEHNIAAAKYIK